MDLEEKLKEQELLRAEAETAKLIVETKRMRMSNYMDWSKVGLATAGALAAIASAAKLLGWIGGA